MKVNTFPRLMKSTSVGKISQQDKALFFLKNKGKSNFTHQRSGKKKKKKKSIPLHWNHTAEPLKAVIPPDASFCKQVCVTFLFNSIRQGQVAHSHPDNSHSAAGTHCLFLPKYTHSANFGTLPQITCCTKPQALEECCQQKAFFGCLKLGRKGKEQKKWEAA